MARPWTMPWKIHWQALPWPRYSGPQQAGPALPLPFRMTPGPCLLARSAPAPDNRAAQKETLSAGAVPGCQILFHDARNHEMTDFGTTSRGVPVKVNAAVGRADIKIVVGQVDPHQFVGFTGGAKGIAVGRAASETICRNHGLMFEPNAGVACWTETRCGKT